MGSSISPSCDANIVNGVVVYSGSYPNESVLPLPNLVTGTTPSINVYLR